MINVNDYIAYIVPVMFWFGVSVGGYAGVVVGLLLSGLRLRRHEKGK